MIEGMAQLEAAMLQLIDPARMKRLLKAVGTHAAKFIKRYPAVNRPTRASVYGTPFVSNKQRRWFFAALRRGDIDVPYKRGGSRGSQNLLQSWAVEVISKDSVQAGTHVTYAPLVKDADKQSKYMAAIGWTTLQADIADNTDSIEQAYETGLHQTFDAWRD